MLDSMGLTVDDIKAMCPDTDKKSVNELKKKLNTDYKELAVTSGLQISMLGALIQRGELDRLREV